jgi:hypothetical protein
MEGLPSGPKSFALGAWEVSCLDASLPLGDSTKGVADSASWPFERANISRQRLVVVRTRRHFKIM